MGVSIQRGFPKTWSLTCCYSNGYVHYCNYNFRYAFTRDISVQPPIDPIQNVDNLSAAFEDGVTTVMFSRLKDTGDVNDFSLSNCIYFLFAWGGDVTNITSREISYHGASRRFISDSLICIPTSTSFCPEKCKINFIT